MLDCRNDFLKFRKSLFDGLRNLLVLVIDVLDDLRYGFLLQMVIQ